MEREIIDDALLFEYPFAKEGMFADDYWEERLYWGMHLTEVREGTYKPIWKQRMGEIGDECVKDEFFNIEYRILSELRNALGKSEVDISRFDAYYRSSQRAKRSRKDYNGLQQHRNYRERTGTLAERSDHAENS